MKIFVLFLCIVCSIVAIAIYTYSLKLRIKEVKKKETNNLELKKNDT